ncbi:succinylglutamate desuccinylase/aspartoacylase family protein [Halarchaeum sp. CBA1220]|uniref:succinylglutamate desuccinylase/aspartoacylase domain-containing protein n=1 Tax=Halarchaeum sp. CBA1220 TaxID=1853682 RepID=UPI000F3A9E07|nr:succinylglutamate desuccinylase/aspartoacylase family protein [Halarchaeum sp. CBA1220]QLC32724.1 succinylglutamate desuccinylase/aspartoacylase family protein [Halarchaeum sp. CBA1220]
MRVVQLGDGTPEISVVGGVHGDEPCGARAIERLEADDPDVERPVKLVVANELALERGVRYVDADLNRAFGEDTPADAHERRVAESLAEAVEGTTALSIHSTQSHADPFAVSDGREAHVQRYVPQLSVAALVDTTDFGEGRLFAANADIVEVEAGLQGTETAAENAYTLAREFLTAAGALPGDTVSRELPTFAMGDPIPKPPAEEYEVFAENFTEVEAGEPYAAADGDVLVAEEDFWPVLFSPYGYEDQFGYRGEPAPNIGQSPSEGANSTSRNSRSSAQ